MWLIDILMSHSFIFPSYSPVAYFLHSLKKNSSIGDGWFVNRPRDKKHFLFGSMRVKKFLNGF